MRSEMKREAGIGKITLLVFGVIIAAAVYGAYRVIPVYYYFFELQNQMQSLIKVASVTSDQEIRKKLAVQMKRMEIPATIDEARIERSGHHMRISLRYDEELWIDFRGKSYHLHTFKLNAFAEADY